MNRAISISLFPILLLLQCAGNQPGESQYGDTYDAYRKAGGPVCGQGGNVACKPGDHCASQDTSKCQTVLSGAYDAYSDADGPVCGYGPYGGLMRCKPGDTCLGQEAVSCETRDDGTYDAYGKAGGADCGYGPYGGSIYCKPGGTCLSEGHCK